MTPSTRCEIQCPFFQTLRSSSSAAKRRQSLKLWDFHGKIHPEMKGFHGKIPNVDIIETSTRVAFFQEPGAGIAMKVGRWGQVNG
jgi:hypothetical protein